MERIFPPDMEAISKGKHTLKIYAKFKCKLNFPSSNAQKEEKKNVREDGKFLPVYFA
jgi:hypothetical protein